MFKLHAACLDVCKALVKAAAEECAALELELDASDRATASAKRY